MSKYIKLLQYLIHTISNSTYEHKIMKTIKTIMILMIMTTAMVDDNDNNNDKRGGGTVYF